MGLAGLQSALARLYTDAAARESLLGDPEGFGARHGLSSAETETLARKLLPEIQLLAVSLLRKRRREAVRAMPLAREALGDRLGQAFGQFATASPLGPMRNPALDALAFHHWLLAKPDSGVSPGERDALRYSQGWLIMQETPRLFLLRFLRIGPDGRRSCAIWWRWRGRLRHCVIRLPLI